MLAITPPIWHPNRFRPQFDDGLSQQYLILVIILKAWLPETFVKKVMTPHPCLIEKKDQIGIAK